MDLQPLSDDTIVALASAPGRAGIAVVRISGPDAWAIGAKIAGLASAPRSLAGTFRHVRFRTREGETADDGVILFFAAPRSYTGEDVVELWTDCMKKVIEKSIRDEKYMQAEDQCKHLLVIVPEDEFGKEKLEKVREILHPKKDKDTTAEGEDVPAA